MSELPFPPDEIIFTSVGRADKNLYLATGLADRNHVLSFLHSAGLDTARGKCRVLDLGCGSGRVARHWESLRLNVDLFGCDVAETPVRWCQENLSFGKFAVSTHNPPLDYPDGYFDAIYAISVLTHLTFESHYLWMRELWRLLKSDGVAVLTVAGPTLLPKRLSSIARNIPKKVNVNLIDGAIFLCVDFSTEGQGTNQTGSLEQFEAFSKIFYPFSILEYKPCHGLMGIQDAYVLKKKSSDGLTVIENFLDADMSGHNFHSEVKLTLNGEKNFCVLAAARNLVKPATIQLALRHSGSGETIAMNNPVDLPSKAHWAGLDNAFSSVVIENFPQVHGPALISVNVSGSDQLNGSQLQLKQAILF